MADRKQVANKQGPSGTNKVTVETGYSLASGYELLPFDQKKVGETGYHKVLRVFPSDDHSEAPRFLARWDEKDKALDFDLVDREDRVQPAKPYGHRSTALGDRRFQVEIGSDSDNIVFKGIVKVALDFTMPLDAGAYNLTGSNACLIPGTGIRS